MVYRSWAEINLSNLEKNLKNIYEFSKKHIFAVVKADAYGHGAVKIAKFLENFKQVRYLCVATAEEGKELKEAGIKKPVLVLGGMLEEEIDIFNEYNLIPVISDFYHLKLIKKLRTKKIHIKFDTGMNRLGFYKKDIPEIVKYLSNIDVEGIMSHFPSADLDQNYTREQIKEFFLIKEKLKMMLKTKFKYIHIQNTAGTIYKCDFCNSIRIGIGLYGTKPFENFPVELKQVMTVKAKVISIKEIKKGSKISYTGSFTADRDMKVAVVSFGYADGLPRSLSNKGYFLIKGKKAKIVGNITMDMTIVDISDISNINIGDEVIILGEQITFDKVSKIANTIPYEIMCSISKRVFRKTIREKNETVINTCN